MKKHKHAEIIKAWEDGKTVEVYDDFTDEWVPTGKYPGTTPNFSKDRKYRIKERNEVEKRYMHIGDLESQYFDDFKQTPCALWYSNLNMSKYFSITFTSGKITEVEFVNIEENKEKTPVELTTGI